MYPPTNRQTNEDAGKPTVSEAEMVRALLAVKAPEDGWPPVLLARYKARMIEGVGNAAEP